MLTAYYLYRATFEFPENCRFPTISVRYEDTLINVNSSGQQTYYWLWGVELIQAITLCGAKIKFNSVIKYEGHYTHRSFIEYFYEQRQQAKREGNAVMDLFCKLMMNSEYGKHGQ